MRSKYKYLVIFVILFLFSFSLAENKQYSTKEDYYKYLAAKRGIKVEESHKGLRKVAGSESIKRSILDVGNVRALIENTAILGYDRYGLCWEYPSKSGVTYRWTMAPLVGAIIDGTKRMADGTHGALRQGDEFLPYYGYDAGYNDMQANIGIAFSDVPASWPAQWPNGTIDQKFPVGQDGFKGVVNGEVRATREAYFVVSDSNNNNGEGVMGVRMDIWALQWSDFLNRNFIIFKFVVTNNSDKEWKDVYLGVHDDPDCPEQGDREWTDDFAAFIAPGDTTVDSLLWNFSYLWDGDDYVGGLFASGVGWVGLKVLETPIDPATGKEKGLTTMQVFPYDQAPQSEEDAYNQMAAGIMEPPNKDPHPDDWTQTPNTYGPDITYVLATGPFDLKPGESINFAFASIHGSNKADLFNNAKLCQMLYNNEYKSAEAPPVPELKAYVEEGKVVLYWDDRAERGIYYKKDANGNILLDENGDPIVDHINDALTGNNAFQGYKLYKSTDGGITWGQAFYDFKGVPKGYIPLAIFDKKDLVKGESKTRPYFDLGDDTGLRHYYVDNNVKNGYEYLYALVAYDGEDSIVTDKGAIPIVPLENAIPSNPYIPGDNVVAVKPHGPAFGTTLGDIDTLYHSAGSSDAMPVLEVLDKSSTTGDTYEISINVDETSGEKTFTVMNKTTNKVARTDNEVEVVNWPFYNSDYDNAPIVDGVKITMTDAEPGIKSYSWSGNSDAEIVYSGIYDVYYPDTYEFVWDSTALNVAGAYGSGPLPFYIINKTKNDTCSHYLWGGEFGSGSQFLIIEADGAFTHVMQMYYDNEPAQGEVCTIITNQLLTANDKFVYKTIKETTSTIKESDLEKIKVVPNPYVVTSRFETGQFMQRRKIQFHYLPPKCTIRIFNTAGNLIKVIEHTNGTPIEEWDLRTKNDQEIAFGVYIFQVEAEGIGKYIGKFAVIK